MMNVGRASSAGSVVMVVSSAGEDTGAAEKVLPPGVRPWQRIAGPAPYNTLTAVPQPEHPPPRPSGEATMTSERKRKSLTTTDGIGRAPNRAMLRAVGFLDEDFTRPMVGIADLFSDITPCNAHLDRLARKAAEGVRAAGGVPQLFGAPTASDGIMMGHQGMRYSLVSREVIADSIEVVCGGMNHDGIVAVGGCDKNMPGCVMALARLNVPGVFVYGGSILPGVGPDGEDVDIVSIFEAVGRNQAGKLDAAGVHKIEC